MVIKSSEATSSQFLRDPAMEKVSRGLLGCNKLKLTAAEADALFEVLRNPPKANEKLLEAAQSYKDTVIAG